MIIKNSGPDISLDEAVLFPFDKWSMPMRYRLRYGMVTATNPYKLHGKVLLSGDRQSPDGLGMHYYGTVIRVGDELRMWYGGMGEDNGQRGMRMGHGCTFMILSARADCCTKSPINKKRKLTKTPFCDW